MVCYGFHSYCGNFLAHFGTIFQKFCCGAKKNVLPISLCSRQSGRCPPPLCCHVVPTARCYNRPTGKIVSHYLPLKTAGWHNVQSRMTMLGDWNSEDFFMNMKTTIKPQISKLDKVQSYNLSNANFLQL